MKRGWLAGEDRGRARYFGKALVELWGGWVGFQRF